MSQTWFLTGALGCIGAWVTKQVLDRGDTPVVFDLSDDARRLRDLVDEDTASRVRFVRGDITDLEAVTTAMEGATRVVHLAGLQVPFCKADPPKGASVNVLGTLHVFEAAKRVGVERLVYASSAAVYGPPEGEAPPDEGAPAEATTHYGIFKRANEGSARIYWLDDGVSSVGLRPLTVYGVGRDQGLTSGPTVAMKAAVLGRDYGVPFTGATDFNYVGDTAAAFLACAERGPEGAHVFNLHGDSVPVAAILDTIRAHPLAGGLLHAAGPELPIPPALDGSALAGAVPDLPHTPLADGIDETMTRFHALAEAGRLDTRDLDA